MQAEAIKSAAATFLVTLAIAGLEKVSEGFHGDFALLEKVSKLTDVQIGVSILAGTMVVVAASMLISIRILEKKEY